MKRTLVLAAERLAELSNDELRVVNGGDYSKPNCLTNGSRCDVSELGYSLCHCHTGYCSIECG